MLARLTGWPPPELFVTVSITSGTAAARSASSASSAATSLRRGLAAIPGVRLLGPDLDAETLPVATFTVEGVPHALVAARLAAEYAIGVGHSRFCAYPYLIRLLGLTRGEIHRTATRRGARIAERCRGLSRASAGINISDDDVRRLLAAVASIAAGDPPVRYHQDPLTCDFFPAESTFAERVPRARSG
jgi:selenocysteine lyase/cysteine desulfurase